MSARGFTLIEILVALTILAVALAAAARSTTSSLGASEQARLRLLAGWVAENRLAEHHALQDWPNFGRQEGRQVQAGENFVWRETTSSTPNSQFRRLEIRVASEAAPDYSLVSLSSLLAKPGR